MGRHCVGLSRLTPTLVAIRVLLVVKVKLPPGQRALSGLGRTFTVEALHKQLVSAFFIRALRLQTSNRLLTDRFDVEP